MSGQYDAQISNYWAAIGYYNPGYAGQTGKLEITALNRQQWLGFTNAPGTMHISADMSLNFLGRAHGVGAIVFSENIGLFKHSILAGQYAYKKKLFKGDFSAGIQVSKIDDSWFGSKVDIKPPEENEFHEETDPGIPTADITASTIDFSAGLFYSKKQWYVGLSVTHLLEPEMKEKDGTPITGGNALRADETPIEGQAEEPQESSSALLYLPRGYYLLGGYNIQFSNPLLELRPSMRSMTVK